MEKTVEDDVLKAQKRKKIIIGVLIALGVLYVVWTAIVLAQNPNKTERTVLNAVIGAVQDSKHPTETALLECGEIVEAKTNEGKDFRYCVVKLKLKDDNGTEVTDYYCLTVGGSGKNKLYSKANISDLKSPESSKIQFSINKDLENVRVKRVNSTLSRYWNFQDKK